MKSYLFIIFTLLTHMTHPSFKTIKELKECSELNDLNKLKEHKVPTKKHTTFENSSRDYPIMQNLMHNVSLAKFNLFTDFKSKLNKIEEEEEEEESRPSLPKNESNNAIDILWKLIELKYSEELFKTYQEFFKIYHCYCHMPYINQHHNLNFLKLRIENEILETVDPKTLDKESAQSN